MSSLQVTFSGVPVLFVLGALLGALFAWYAYRATVPPVPTFVRYFLALVKGFSLAALILLLGEPLFSLVTEEEQNASVALLVDNSGSMTVADRAESRDIQMRRILSSDPVTGLLSGIPSRTFLVDGTTRPVLSLVADSVPLRGTATDLSQGFRAIASLVEEQNLRAVVLISDGIHNSGEPPLRDAEALGVPVHTILVGDTVELQDLSVVRVLSNSIAYAGVASPVAVSVQNNGFDNITAQVTIRQGPSTLDTARIRLSSAVREIVVPLSFVPREKGTQRLTAEIELLPGERSSVNNRNIFSLRVLESKVKILLVAGIPTPDVGFIHRTLRSQTDIEVTLRTEMGEGGFYEGPLTLELLAEADGLVLVGYPTSVSKNDDLRRIVTAASDKGIFFVPSRQFDPVRARPLEVVLPVTFGVRDPVLDEYEVFASVNPAFRFHPFLAGQPASEKVWEQLPPVFRSPIPFGAKPESNLLLFQRVRQTSSGEPMLVIRSVAGKRSIALTAYGIWRWKMMSQGIEGAESAIDRFFVNSIRWLTSREDLRQFRAEPAMPTFGGSDPVLFSAQVYDEVYDPIDDAAVTLEVRGSAGTLSVPFQPAGAGRYTASIASLPEGEYSFVAKADRNGTPLGEDAGTFGVGALTLEFLEQTSDASLLRQISARTGGLFLVEKDLSRLSEVKNLLEDHETKKIVRASEFDPYHMPLVLLMLLILLSTEWLIRRIHGML